MKIQKEGRRELVGWVTKTTLINVLLVAVCFIGILGVMLITYKSAPDLTKDIIGEWHCEQFYKNQESFQVPDSQQIVVTIRENGEITLTGSANASIFRNASRKGTYIVEGGSTLRIDMGDELWTCACVFTSDRLLRITIPEVETVLYLDKEGN